MLYHGLWTGANMVFPVGMNKPSSNVRQAWKRMEIHEKTQQSIDVLPSGYD